MSPKLKGRVVSIVNERSECSNFVLQTIPFDQHVGFRSMTIIIFKINNLLSRFRRT